MLANILRDRELHEPTRRVTETHMEAWGASAWSALTEGFPADRAPSALLALALEFGTWRSLAGSGLSPADAARVMASATRGCD